MSDEMHELSAHEELMKVAAKVFRQFLSEIDCTGGSIEVSGNAFEIVTVKGNTARFTRGMIDD